MQAIFDFDLDEGKPVDWGEGKVLHSFLKKLEAAKTAQAGFLLVLDFAKKCFTGVGVTLTAGTKKGEAAKQSKRTKYPLVLHAANTYRNTDAVIDQQRAFEAELVAEFEAKQQDSGSNSNNDEP